MRTDGATGVSVPATLAATVFGGAARGHALAQLVARRRGTRRRLRRRTVFLQLRLFRTGIDRFRPFGLLIRPTGRHRPGAFLDRTEERTDGDRLAVLGGDIGEYTGCGRRHLDRDLVGLELHHRLVDGHHVAGFLEPLADRRFGHRLAKHGHANLSHDLVPRSRDRRRGDDSLGTKDDGEQILDLSLVVLRRR